MTPLTGPIMPGLPGEKFVVLPATLLSPVQYTPAVHGSEMGELPG
jgi:hypothetical protein